MNRMAFHTNPNIDKIVREHYCKNSNYFFDDWHQKYFSLLHKKITSDDWKDLYNAILKDCETILKTDLKETSDIFDVTHSEARKIQSALFEETDSFREKVGNILNLLIDYNFLSDDYDLEGYEFDKMANYITTYFTFPIVKEVWYKILEREYKLIFDS